MATSTQTFGQWVRERRKQRNLTQKALGMLAGYAEITVRQIEKNSYVLTRFVVERFVNYLATERDDSEAIIRFALKQIPVGAEVIPSSINYRPRTQFIGRTAELAQIDGLLRNPDCRCISVVGIGGVGKTRLALQVVNAFNHNSDQEAWFVNLTEITSYEGMARAIADVLGIALIPFAPVSEQLLQVLQTRHMLLVLDNFEQLLPEGTQLLTLVLERAQGIKLLITSRERLQMSTEWTIRLQGLDTNKLASEQDAVDLFLSVAQRINNSFDYSDIETLQAICQVLQGIPLAIEMAASWIELYSNAEILSSVSTKLFDLTSRHSDIDERHKSLWAVFETTWERLSLREQETLKQLAVFRGGFTVTAAQSVTGASMDVLAYLQDKMLIQPHSEGRIVLHEIIHQFSYQKLASDKDDLIQTQERHAKYYVNLLSENRLKIIHSETHHKSMKLLPDVENITLAWQTMLTLNRIDWFMECWECAMFLMNNTSRFREGEDLFRTAAATFNQDPLTHKHAFGIAQSHYSWFLFRQGRLPEASTEQFIADINFLRDSADISHRSWVHIIDSFIYHGIGDAQSALNSAQTSLALLEENQLESNQQYRASVTYFQLGRSELLLGNLVNANQHLEKSLNISKTHKVLWSLDMILTELGYVAEEAQQYADALRYYEVVLSTSISSTDLWNYLRTQISIGRMQFALGEVGRAIDSQLTVLRFLTGNSMSGLEIDSFVEIAQIFHHFEDHILACTLLEYCAVHPECYQPTRDRAKSYLATIQSKTPSLDISTARILLPINKLDVATMLLERLVRIGEN